GDADQPPASRGATTGAGPALTAQEFLLLLIDPRTVILTEKYARRHGLAAGSQVSLVIGDREAAFTVRGLLRDEGPAKLLDGNLVLMDLAAAQWAMGRLGHVDRVDVQLRDPSTIDTAEQAIAARLPDGLTAQRPARRGAQVERMLAAFHLNLNALAWVALLVGLFLVYNTVSTSVIVRREEVGTLRALGVSRRAVLGLFLGEATVLAAAGTAIGVGLGRVLADAAVGLTSTTVNALYVASASAPPALSAPDVLVAALVGVPLSLAAAALPALEAARVSPLAAIRGADRLETRFAFGWRRLIAPLVLLALGAWLATLPPIDGLPVAGFASAFTLVFGAAFLVPLVLFAFGRFGRVVMGRAFGVAGALANANLAGAIPRVSVSVAALAVSLSMMVAIAIMIGSFRDTVAYWVGDTLKADLFVGPAARANGPGQSAVSEEVERLVASHPLVADVDRFRTSTIDYGDVRVTLTAGDFGVVARRGNLVFKAPADGLERLRLAAGRDQVVVSEPFANRHGVGVGGHVELKTPAGPRRFEVVAVYFDYSSDRGVLAMDAATFARHFGGARPTGLSVYLVDGASPDEVRDALLRALAPDQRIFVYTNAALRAEVLRIFDATFAITYALEAIAIVVAIMGVAGTLLTLILERRREIAMLRLVGAERRQVRRMVVLEAAMLGGASQGVGLAVGLLLSLVLVFVINYQSFGWTIQFHVPWLFLAQMSVAIVVATALSGLYPARLASRIHVAAEVGEE
nr:ABC transporter permease [Vicinamibacterales bacterium]